MDEKSRIQAATILQGIVKGYMNPVRHMSADDENYEKWMRLVERMDQEYAKDPFFEQVMVSLTAEGYLPGGEAGLGYKPARNLLDQWQIEDVIQEFYNSILERKVNGHFTTMQGFFDFPGCPVFQESGEMVASHINFQKTAVHRFQLCCHDAPSIFCAASSVAGHAVHMQCLHS